MTTTSQTGAPAPVAGNSAPGTIIMPSAYVAPGAILEENISVGAHAVILASQDDGSPATIIKNGAEIGANATVVAGVTIGVRAQVRPGAVVTKSVPPLAIVEGNPARITGYVETRGHQNNHPPLLTADAMGCQPSRVRGVSLHTLRMVPDLRGNLSAGEFNKEIPFSPSRYFLVFDVPTIETRGEHAHRHCQQFLLAIKGRVNVVTDDGRAREEFVLDRPHLGLYLPAMTWGIQYRYSADAVLLVFASDYYDPHDYIRDYTVFLKLVEENRTEI